MTRLVTRENWHKMFAMGKEPRGMFEDDYGYDFRRTLNSRRLRSAEARLVTSKKWQKRFAMGKEPRGMFEGAYNYYFRRTLQMHRNKIGYTMANSKGQKVLVTKPFTFGKSRYNEGYASASCPEFKISCILGQVIKNMGWAEINLPYRRLPQKFANPWQVARCQLPPICS